MNGPMKNIDKAQVLVLRDTWRSVWFCALVSTTLHTSRSPPADTMVLAFTCEASLVA